MLEHECVSNVNHSICSDDVFSKGIFDPDTNLLEKAY